MSGESPLLDPLDDLTRSQRWKIADRLAHDVLPRVNATSEVVGFRETFYNRYVKRAFDAVFASVVLVVTLPVHVIMAGLTAVSVGRPLFFVQQRAGRYGKPFSIIKFRNMTNDRGANGDLLPPDLRVTRLGRFFRATSLDELLNLMAVVSGSMSIIGPRPLPPEYVSRYSDRHRVRLAVRPGLECPPMHGAVSTRSWQDQFENDVWYAAHVSFRTDLFLALRLVSFALRAVTWSERVAGTRSAFMGYDQNNQAIDLCSVPEAYITAAHAAMPSAAEGGSMPDDSSVKMTS
jgi:lipopolysaccharide/colanic/teichoic acid biosynthesis glycosyltransferase